jgi:hypothetical protein
MWRPRSPEQALDLLGRSIGRHVEVLGPQAQQQIPNGTANDIGLMAGLLQSADHLDRAFIDLLLVNAVSVNRHLGAQTKTGFPARGFPQQTCDELFDHS